LVLVAVAVDAQGGSGGGGGGGGGGSGGGGGGHGYRCWVLNFQASFPHEFLVHRIADACPTMTAARGMSAVGEEEEPMVGGDIASARAVEIWVGKANQTFYASF